MPSNPIDISIPANSQGFINCVSNASYYQRVTLRWGDHTAIFEGTGEGQPMKLASGDAAYLLEPSPSPYRISIDFQYSTDGSHGPFRGARVSDPVTTGKGLFTVIEITSEDSSDNDKNDSYLTIALVSDDTPHARQPTPAPPAPAMTTTGSSLELHAKTYYDNPLVEGGDEHLLSIPPFDGQWGSLSYRSTGWSLDSYTVWDEQRPFGGYLHIAIKANQCVHPDMHDAVLTLSTIISYWGSKPTGHPTVNWDYGMTGTQYHVTRVTN